MATRPTFAEYHANVIAKEIRALFPLPSADMVKPNSQIIKERELDMVRRGVLAALALNLAKRFKKDGLEYMKFLERCSPDNDLFPITELWDETDG